MDEGGLKRYVKKALETGNSLHRGPVGESGGGGVRLPGTLRYSNIWDRFLGTRGC